MKYALIASIAALGFASAAVAEDSYAKGTLMTRNVPAESILAPRDAAIARFGALSVTVGDQLSLEAADLLNPSEAAIAENGAVVAYNFGGSDVAVETGFGAR